MKNNTLPTNFLSYIEKGSLSISTDGLPTINFCSDGNLRIIDVNEIPIKLSKKPGLIKQLSEAKSLAKNLNEKKLTLEIRLKGKVVLRLGEQASPKLTKILTLSNHIEITDLKKLKELSKVI